MVLIDFVSNGLFLSLPYMNDGSWNWGTVRWRWAYGTQMTWILALSELLIHFSTGNSIDGRVEFTWSSNIWTSSWWGQRMNMSSTYLSHKDDFSDIDPNAISSQYSMYMLANTGDYGEPIASPSSCRYMSDPTLKLSPHIKSTFPLAYLSGYKCILPARGLHPVYPVLQQVSHQ